MSPVPDVNCVSSSRYCCTAAALYLSGMRSDPNDPEVWFDFARRDLSRARIFLREHDSAACALHLQQAAEKFLKGRLIRAGWKLRKTHDLLALLVEAERFHLHGLLRRETATDLIAEYIASQEPSTIVISEPSHEQVQDWMDEVSSIDAAVPTG